MVLEQRQVFVRVALAPQSSAPGLLLVGFGTDDFEQELATIRRQAFVFSALLLGLGWWAAWGLSAWLVRPLEQVSRLARRLSESGLPVSTRASALEQDGTDVRTSEFQGLLEWSHEQADIIEEWKDEADRTPRPDPRDLLIQNLDPQLETALLILQGRALKDLDAAAIAAARR